MPSPRSYSYKDTSHIWPGPVSSNLPSFPLIIPWRFYFQTRSHWETSQGSRFWHLHCGDHTSTHSNTYFRALHSLPFPNCKHHICLLLCSERQAAGTLLSMGTAMNLSKGKACSHLGLWAWALAWVCYTENINRKCSMVSDKCAIFGGHSQSHSVALMEETLRPIRHDGCL